MNKIKRETEKAIDKKIIEDLQTNPNAKNKDRYKHRVRDRYRYKNSKEKCMSEVL